MISQNVSRLNLHCSPVINGALKFLAAVFISSCLAVALNASTCPANAYGESGGPDKIDNAKTQLVFSSDSSDSGEGWRWDAASKTLFLYGADVNSVTVPGSSTIDIVGLNKIHSAITADGAGNLTVKGTGVLKMDVDVSSITCKDDLIIFGGSLSAFQIGDDDTKVNVYDGLVSCSKVRAKIYRQNGGYVKVRGSEDNAILSSVRETRVRGGFLDVRNDGKGNGMYASYIESEGGVIVAVAYAKAIASPYLYGKDNSSGSGVGVVHARSLGNRAAISSQLKLSTRDNVFNSLGVKQYVGNGDRYTANEAIIAGSFNELDNGRLYGSYFNKPFSSDDIVSVEGGNLVEINESSEGAAINVAGLSGSGTVVGYAGASCGNSSCIDVAGDVSGKVDLIGVCDSPDAKSAAVHVGGQVADSSVLGMGESSAGIEVASAASSRLMGCCAEGSSTGVGVHNVANNCNISGFSGPGDGVGLHVGKIEMSDSSASFTAIGAGIGKGRGFVGSYEATRGKAGIYGGSSTENCTASGMGALSAESIGGPFSKASASKPEGEVFHIFETTDPIIEVADQNGSLVYGEQGSAVFPVSACNFGEGEYLPRIEWIDRHEGIEAGFDNAGAVKVSTTAGANAGAYRLGVVSGEGETAVSSRDTTVVIGKARVDGDSVTLNETVEAGSTSTVTVGLSSMIKAGGEVVPGDIVSSDASFVVMDGIASGSQLKVSVKSKPEGTTGTLTIPVRGCANYEDYDVVVTFTAHAAPQGAGSIASPHSTALVRGSKASIEVPVSIRGGGAVSLDDIDQNVISKVGDKSDIAIDLSRLDDALTTLKLSEGTISSLAKSSASGLEVVYPVTRVKLDRQALDALAAIPSKEGVAIAVFAGNSTRLDLTEEQKDAVSRMGDALVFEFRLIARGKPVGNLGEGTVQIDIPYTGSARVCAWHLGTDGIKSNLSCSLFDGNARVTVSGSATCAIEPIVYNRDYAVCAKDSTCPLAGFPDLVASSWYHDGVHFCLDNGLMTGMATGRYAPDEALTRNMFMTVLARLDGVDTSGGEQWYDKGVAWAVENGVSNGEWGEGAITREQMVTMLFRLANKWNLDTSARDDLSSFSDAGSVSDWASDAVQWAVAEGILKGVGDSEIQPQSQATRAQAATFMMRYANKMFG